MYEFIGYLAVWVAAGGLFALAFWRPGWALGTSFVMGVGTTIASVWLYVATGRLAPGACSAVLFPLTLMAVYLYGPLARRETWAPQVAKWTLIVLGATGAAVVSAGFLMVIAPAWLVFLGAVILRLVVLGHRAKVHYVVSTLSACMRQHLPLVGGLQAAAGDRTDGRAMTLRRIALFLAGGAPLSQAIRNGYRGCSGDVIATIQAAEAVDQAPAALARLEADLVTRQGQDMHLRGCTMWYPVILILLICSAASSLYVFVLPAFSRICSDAGGPLPPAMQNLMTFAQYCRLLTWPILVLVMLTAGLWFYLQFRPRRADRFQFWTWLGDRVKWWLPGGRWFERNRSMLRTVEVLRMSLAAGATIDQSIAATAELDVNGCFRQRLRRWLDRVRAGQDVAAAARAAGLGPSLAWALDARTNPGNAPGALEALESIYRCRYGYRLRMLRFITWPLTVVALGVLVGCIPYAMFSTLAAFTQLSMRNLLP